MADNIESRTAILEQIARSTEAILGEMRTDIREMPTGEMRSDARHPGSPGQRLPRS